jgi:O-methyltransferase domain
MVPGGGVELEPFCGRERSGSPGSPARAAFAGWGERIEGLAERLQAIAGNFLENVPSGADLYVLKNVLLDWDDEHTMKILRNCKRVMSASNRLLIVEPLIPGPEEAHLSKLLDLEMLLVPGGRARTVAELTDLLNTADLVVTRILATPGPSSIIEAVLR